MWSQDDTAGKFLLDIAAPRTIDSARAMKNNPVGALLVAGLFLCSLLSISLAIYYLITVRELDHLRGQSVQMNNTMNSLQAMANETFAYSRSNAAVDPILQQYGLKAKPAAPSAPAALPGPVRPTR